METVCTRSLTVCTRLSIFPAPSLSDRLDGERLERALSLAHNARHVAGQIDHRARLDAAGPGIDHQLELALVFLRGCVGWMEKNCAMALATRRTPPATAPPLQAGHGAAYAPPAARSRSAGCGTRHAVRPVPRRSARGAAALPIRPHPPRAPAPRPSASTREPLRSDRAPG